MRKLAIGFALCGSFCTFTKVIPEIERLVSDGYDVFPIMSKTAYSTDTRFGKASDFISVIEKACGRNIIKTISEAEPIGPKKLLDALIIAPCTGNTAAKLACGICDTSVTMAAKAHLRNGRPLIIAISTNDGLGMNMKNIGLLSASKNIFFVPFRQDDSAGKPNSLISDMSKIPDTLKAALEYSQTQPLLV
ncbi:MAG: dipicolinate synthase subunit B [Oscillospiraceae bacterium]|nr:dipicolinate synthase subunit B [Oscillospiraceae bacterium]MBQ4544783.1 dipicolinate synthase subunit B [Oscillospiraceae bacterium]MBQ6901833.1 dipicolinate synthase subunit B [Oscillospiraceae bacterium]